MSNLKNGKMRRRGPSVISIGMNLSVADVTWAALKLNGHRAAAVRQGIYVLCSCAIMAQEEEMHKGRHSCAV